MGWFWIGAFGVLSFVCGERARRWLASACRWADRAWWAYKSRRRSPRGGRPPICGELYAAMHRMMDENPTWGAPRIHGELLKLGFKVAQSTVSKYLRRWRRSGPAPGWKTFLRDNERDIAAIDMLTVTTFALTRLYAVVVIGHGRRRILHTDATDHPTAQWLAQQITEAFPWDEAPVWLVRDNDRAYGLKFRRRLRAMGVRDRPTMPYSPWQNPYAERVIGSIKRECLNRLVILNAAHLRRVLREYAEHYNNDRTHLGLGKDTPNGRPVEAVGKIISEPILGGLHHRYRRIPPK